MLHPLNVTETIKCCSQGNSCAPFQPPCKVAFDETDSYARINMLTTWLNVVGNPAVISIGILGNITCLIVFLFTELRRQSTSAYLAFLSIVDIVFLSTLFINWLAWAGINLVSNLHCCRLTIYLSYISNFLSVWTIVCFTVERWVVVFYPLRRPVWCSRQRAIFILLAFTVVSFLLYLFTFWTAEVTLDGDEEFCQMSLDHYDVVHVMSIIDSLLTVVVPFSAITILNTGIALKIWLVSNRRCTVLKAAGDGLSRQAIKCSAQCQHGEDKSGSQSRSISSNTFPTGGALNSHTNSSNSFNNNAKAICPTTELQADSKCKAKVIWRFNGSLDKAVNDVATDDKTKLPFQQVRGLHSQRRSSQRSATVNTAIFSSANPSSRGDRKLRRQSNSNSLKTDDGHSSGRRHQQRCRETSGNSISFYQLQAEKRVRELHIRATKTLLIISTGKYIADTPAHKYNYVHVM